MENTRETIISSAFSFYTRPIFSKISLSMIASRAGITKAAIYRHFKNKEDLENAMTDRVYSDLFSILKKINVDLSFNSNGILEDVIILLMTHREYLYYLISNHTEVLVDNFLLKLKAMGISLFDNIFADDGSVFDMEAYKRSVYFGGCILYFQIVRNKIYDTLKIQDKYSDVTEYASSLAKFLKNGIGEDVSGISAFRLATLDSICTESMKNVNPMNIVFVSIASIVKEKGIQGLTVESVAKGIGLAKSSIYSKFENKAQMICSLIQDEFREMLRLMNENLKAATSNAERAYIIMETELAYFIKKPELFIVSQWLQFQNTEDVMHDKEAHNRMVKEYFDGLVLYSSYPDLYLPCEDKRIVTSWFMMMPIFLYMHSAKKNMSTEIIQAMLKDIFYMMENGINGGKDEDK